MLHQIYYGSILSLFWFLHYFLPIKIFLFRISKAYFRIIVGLFIPFLFLIMVRDTLEILELKFEGDFILGFLFILFIAPFFIVKTWPLKPLRDPFLRKLILEFLSLHRVKFKEIYIIHDKEKKFFTAGIVGLIPPFRYLFFSNNLLEILEPEEILGVLAHEIGHIKKRHFFWLLLVLFNFPFFLLVSFIFIFYPLSYLIKFYNSLILEILIAFLFIILSLLYLRYVFAYFLRQFEREADLYSLYLLRDERPLIIALLKIGEATKQLYKKSWHHYGILERIEFLNKAKKEFPFLKNFTKKIKILLLIWIFINLAVIFFFRNSTFYFLKIFINF
ncbi:MAG: M48 family metallopeptidase [Thermodesulfobacteriaceae bacterium]|nr:M48 family metallopeptidase [Thermodesulfobacteriaceae bacterium]MDW8136742.1 M48 family metallopeptidase [Thermodesulfobacterium sp.]